MFFPVRSLLISMKMINEKIIIQINHDNINLNNKFKYISCHLNCVLRYAGNHCPSPDEFPPEKCYMLYLYICIEITMIWYIIFEISFLLFSITFRFLNDVKWCRYNQFIILASMLVFKYKFDVIGLENLIVNNCFSRLHQAVLYTYYKYMYIMHGDIHPY